MPDMSGIQVLEELRSSPHTRGIPVIIHSSKALDGTEEQALRAQALAIFPKRALSETFATKELYDLLVKANVLSAARMQRHA